MVVGRINKEKTTTMRKHKPVVYIAGVYSDGNRLDATVREINRLKLQEYGRKFLELGCAVIMPIENDYWAYRSRIITYDTALENDFAVINKCDFIFFCPGYKEGSGAMKEYEFAIKNKIPILFDSVLDIGSIKDLVKNFSKIKPR